MQKNKFTKSVEKMIDPFDVGTLLFMEGYSKMIPVSVQKKMVGNSKSKNPYMGFVVEPYSFFLCYELVDLEWAKKLLPDNYILKETKIFDDEEPKFYCIFGCFNVHTSAFWGTRMEFYIIAENKDTGMMSWVIIDYNTNTLSYDEKNGLGSGNTSDCVLTTDFEGEIVAEIKDKTNNRQLVFDGPLKNGKNKNLFSRLWLEGNLSIAYGRELSNNKGQAFAVILDPKEVVSALSIPCEDITIDANTWFKGLFAEKPSQLVCFPFAQHLLSDAPGHFTSVKNEQELVNIMNKLDFDSMPKYSSKAIKKAFGLGQLFSLGLTILLIILLFLK